MHFYNDSLGMPVHPYSSEDWEMESQQAET